MNKSNKEMASPRTTSPEKPMIDGLPQREDRMNDLAKMGVIGFILFAVIAAGIEVWEGRINDPTSVEQTDRDQSRP